MFKIAPGDFVKPPTPTMSRWCSNQLSYATVVFQLDFPREWITRAIPALIHKDVMYASNAGAFACRPYGAILRMFKLVLSVGHPGLTKNSGVCHPGKPVQRVNVPLAHFLFPLHPDEFVELGTPTQGAALTN